LEFIAVDLEFTGLPKSEVETAGAETYFSNAVNGAREFAAVQSGVCLAGRLEDDQLWYTEPYNFYLYPRRRRVCRLDTHSISFLRDNGFDYAEWIDSG